MSFSDLIIICTKLFIYKCTITQNILCLIFTQSAEFFLNFLVLEFFFFQIIHCLLLVFPQNHTTGLLTKSLISLLPSQPTIILVIIVFRLITFFGTRTKSFTYSLPPSFFVFLTIHVHSTCTSISFTAAIRRSLSIAPFSSGLRRMAKFVLKSHKKIVTIYFQPLTIDQTNLCKAKLSNISNYLTRQVLMVTFLPLPPLIVADKRWSHQEACVKPGSHMPLIYLGRVVRSWVRVTQG